MTPSQCRPLRLSQREAARRGREAATILAEGGYASPSGEYVQLAAAIARMREAKRSIRFDAPLALPPRASARNVTTIEVVRESTLAAVARLRRQANGPLYALNLASARRAGGGFLSGARSQEESLARSTALYGSLNGDPMYAHHNAHCDHVYTDWIIVSPDVPVFRDDDAPGGPLLDTPWSVGFLTAAAPNLAALGEGRSPSSALRARVQRAFAQRIARVLDVARTIGARTLVLGAWGCGAFGNDSADVAPLFRDALRAREGAFDHVTFAILDDSRDSRFAGAFERAFEDDGPG